MWSSEVKILVAGKELFPSGQAWWLMSIIPATWKAEIGRITDRDQSGQMVMRHYLT
jgi:hypothetical protein